MTTPTKIRLRRLTENFKFQPRVRLPCLQDEKKADDQVEDQVELMEWQSPWPFLSMADEKLCELSAGVHWPWKPSMASKLKDTASNTRELHST